MFDNVKKREDEFLTFVANIMPLLEESIDFSTIKIPTYKQIELDDCLKYCGIKVVKDKVKIGDIFSYAIRILTDKQLGMVTKFDGSGDTNLVLVKRTGK